MTEGKFSFTGILSSIFVSIFNTESDGYIQPSVKNKCPDFIFIL